MSTQLLYRPVQYCAISMQSYTGFATRDDVHNVIIIHAYTAVKHDAIISVELLGAAVSTNIGLTWNTTP